VKDPVTGEEVDDAGCFFEDEFLGPGK